jgi:hypothetical protein
MRLSPAPLVLAISALLLGFAATASADLGHPTDPDVVVAAATGDRSTWFPTVERLRDGTLVVVYYDATSHTGPDGRIAMTRSKDGGRTWSTPTVALDTSLDDRDPSLVELSDGTLLLNWFQTDWSTPLPTPGGVWTARSVNGGRTWSAPVRARSGTYGLGEWAIPPVTYATPWIATSAKVVELPDRSLLLPVYGNTPTDASPSITILRSRDSGRTWPESLETPVAEHVPGNAFHEPAIALLGNGSLQLAIRTNNVGYWTSSRDGGRTWAVPQPTGPFFEQASDLVPMREGGDRLLLQTWGDRSGAFGPGRPTIGRIITPDGTRHEPKVIYSRGAFDESYPSSVQVGPGTFFTVFYDAQRRIIGGTYSRIWEYFGN